MFVYYFKTNDHQVLNFNSILSLEKNENIFCQPTAFPANGKEDKRIFFYLGLTPT